MKIEIWQGKIKDREDSFWYEGVVASVGQYLLLACGDIRIVFPEDNFNEWHKDHHAVEEAYNRKYTDKDLKKLEWGNNNWFEVIEGHQGENGILHIENCRELDVEYDYNSAIEMLKRYVKEKEYGEVVK